MSLTLDLSPSEVETIVRRAEREGLSLTEYARRRLLTPQPTDEHVVGKPFVATQFYGIVPLPDEEIDAHIADVEASRDEWDARDWRQMDTPVRRQP